MVLFVAPKRPPCVGALDPKRPPLGVVIEPKRPPEGVLVDPKRLPVVVLVGHKRPTVVFPNRDVAGGLFYGLEAEVENNPVEGLLLPGLVDLSKGFPNIRFYYGQFSNNLYY